MEESGVKETLGCSMFEVENKVLAFLVGDKSHLQYTQMNKILETLKGQMEAAGYVPNTNFVLHDVEEEVKENMLYNHNEKMAIDFQ